MTAVPGTGTADSARAGVPPRLIAVGALCTTTVFRVDKIPPAPAKTLAQQMIQVVDGMAISAACAFQRLGGAAAVWARIGDDAIGRAARETLRHEGLDVTGLHAIAGANSSLATVIVDGRGERLVVPFHDPQTDRSPYWLPLAALSDAGMVHCDVRWPEGAEAAMRAALLRSLPTMLDGDVGPQEVLRRLLPLTTYAVFSDAGLRAFTGLHDIEQGLRQVLAMAHDLPPALWVRRHVGASCGSEGYFWLQDGVLQHVAAPRVEVVDTLAAGDVFHGAFALAILEGLGVAQAARFACAAASLKCTQFGGRLGCPQPSELQAFLAAS